MPVISIGHSLFTALQWYHTCAMLHSSRASSVGCTKPPQYPLYHDVLAAMLILVGVNVMPRWAAETRLSCFAEILFLSGAITMRRNDIAREHSLSNDTMCA